MKRALAFSLSVPAVPLFRPDENRTQIFRPARRYLLRSLYKNSYPLCEITLTGRGCFYQTTLPVLCFCLYCIMETPPHYIVLYSYRPYGMRLPMLWHTSLFYTLTLLDLAATLKRYVPLHRLPILLLYFFPTLPSYTPLIHVPIRISILPYRRRLSPFISLLYIFAFTLCLYFLYLYLPLYT